MYIIWTLLQHAGLRFGHDRVDAVTGADVCFESLQCCFRFSGGDFEEFDRVLCLKGSQSNVGGFFWVDFVLDFGCSDSAVVARFFKSFVDPEFVLLLKPFGVPVRDPECESGSSLDFIIFSSALDISVFDLTL